MGKRYVLGDIHGEYKQLMAVLKAVDFDYENDHLIQLGDVVDRGAESFECVEELLKIKNLIAIRGNHDATWFDSLRTGTQNILFNQGGKQTYASYIKHCGTLDAIPNAHLQFFKNQFAYYQDGHKNLFIHGGFNRHKMLEYQEQNIYIWDRDLWLAALSYEAMKDQTHPFKYKDEFKEIFIGHTPTTYWDCPTPMHAANIWNLDTGCGKGGLLTIMNIETKEYVQA